MDSNRVVFSIDLQDNASAVLKSFQSNAISSIGGLQKLFKSLDKGVLGSVKRINQLSNSLQGLRSKSPIAGLREQAKSANTQMSKLVSQVNKLEGKSTNGISAGIHKASGQMDTLISKASKFRNILDGTRPAMGGTGVPGLAGLASGKSGGSRYTGNLGFGGGVLGSLKGTAAVMGSYFAIDSVMGIAKGVVETTAMFERFESVLTNTLGDNGQAKGAIQMLQDFAVNTPYSIDQVTDSFTKLANRGVKIGLDQLNSIGNMASVLGKPFEQLNESILDINNSRRWSEIGIKVVTIGSKIRGTFRGVTVEADRTERGALSMIERFSKMPGVAGTMASISKTLGGQLSNLGDKFINLKKIMGEQSGGIFNAAIQGLNKLVDFFSELFQKTKPIKNALEVLWLSLAPVRFAFEDLAFQLKIFRGNGSWAEKVITAITWAIQKLTTPLSWAANKIYQLTQYVIKNWEAFKALTITTLGLYAAFKTFSYVSTITTLIKDLKKSFIALNVTMAANPVALVLASVVALAIGFAWLYDESEKFRGALFGFIEVAKELGKEFETGFKQIGDAYNKYLAPVVDALSFVSNLLHPSVTQSKLPAVSATSDWSTGLEWEGHVNGVSNNLNKWEAAWQRGLNRGKFSGGLMDGFFNMPNLDFGAIAKKFGYTGNMEIKGATSNIPDTSSSDSTLGSYKGRESSTQGGLVINIQNMLSGSFKNLMDSTGQIKPEVERALINSLSNVIRDSEYSFGR